MSLVPSVSGFHYYVLYNDDFSCYSWIYPMKRKSEVFDHFKTFVSMIHNLFHATIIVLQVIVVPNMSIHPFLPFVMSTASNNGILAPTLHSKMGFLNENITTLPPLFTIFSTQPTYITPCGLKWLLLQLTLLIFFPHLF